MDQLRKITATELAPSIEVPPLAQWTTKNGSVKTRFTETGKLDLPRKDAAFIALEIDTHTWVADGNFKYIITDVRALLSPTQTQAVQNKVNCVVPDNKKMALAFLEAAIFEFTHKTVKNVTSEVDPKGPKLRMVNLLHAIKFEELQRETLKAEAKLAKLEAAKIVA